MHNVLVPFSFSFSLLISHPRPTVSLLGRAVFLFSLSFFVLWNRMNCTGYATDLKSGSK